MHSQRSCWMAQDVRVEDAFAVVGAVGRDLNNVGLGSSDASRTERTEIRQKLVESISAGVAVTDVGDAQAARQVWRTRGCPQVAVLSHSGDHRRCATGTFWQAVTLLSTATAQPLELGITGVTTSLTLLENVLATNAASCVPTPALAQW